MNNYVTFVKLFFKDNKKYIFASFFVFILWILLYLFTPIDENIKKTLIQQTIEYVQTIMTTNSFELFMKIFFNNAFIWLLIVLSGFLLSVLWVFFVFSNIFIVWLVLTISIEKVWLYHSLLAILPHWILEITAVLLSLALSFKITNLVVKKIWNWKTVKIWWELRKTLLFFGWFVLPLFLVAGAIESFITPLFLK